MVGMRLLCLTLLFVASACQTVEETVKVGQVKCGRVNFRCNMKVTYKSDCSRVVKVVPTCTPKKAKCTGGVPISIDTANGCTVTGIYKSGGNKKQSVTKISISQSGGSATTTTTTAPFSPVLKDTVNIRNLKCGLVTYKQCKITISYVEDCTRVVRIMPACTPKKSKCTKGTSVSFYTPNGCIVTGQYKNTGKKQSMSQISISSAVAFPATSPGSSEVAWSDWEDWSECNSSSSNTMKFRLRHCMNSPTSAACEGDAIETAPCPSESLNQTQCQSTTNATVTEVSWTGFFDFVFTHSNVSRNVTCCHLDNTPRTASCGQGASCAGKCAALGAPLCPSSNCTEDPKTCNLDFKTFVANQGQTPVTLPANSLNWCTNSKHQCRVRKHPECCYSSTCLTWPGRKDACDWLNYLTGKRCPFPGSLPHGSWTCEVQDLPIYGASLLEEEEAQTYPALQCRLECESGYIAHKTPIITCVNGEYQPLAPSAFVCQPAAALIINQRGQLEIFSESERCSMALTTFPKFAGIGRTLSLLDEELILVGNDDFGTKQGRYISIQKPRDGLLAMKYTLQNIPLKGSPHRHTSLVSRNTLAIVGGKFKSKGILSKFTWTQFSLHWQNGTKFRPDFSAACSVKADVDVHIIFGGERIINHKTVSVERVVKINTTQQVAVEMKPMAHRRKFHGCELLNNSLVLLSGGLDKSVIQPDEIYNITSEEVVAVLSPEKSLGRNHHAIVRMGERVYALGGNNSGNTQLSKISQFNPNTFSWSELDRELLSANTTEFVMSPFPLASLDCVPECQCGIKQTRERIFGGRPSTVSYVDL